jgi:hypothetical protein
MKDWCDWDREDRYRAVKKLMNLINEKGVENDEDKRKKMRKENDSEGDKNFTFQIIMILDLMLVHKTFCATTILFYFPF